MRATIRLYVEQFRLIQTLCGGTGVTDVTDVTDIMNVTDITDVADVTDIRNITNVTDITGGTVRHMAYYLECVFLEMGSL